MRNVIETDPAEVGGLMSFDLSPTSRCSASLPAVLVWRVALPSSTWRVRLRQRLVFIGSALALCAVALFACSANYAVFFREHKPVRYALSPAAPLVSFAGLLSAKERRDPHATADRPRRQRAAHRGGRAPSRWCCSWSSARPRGPRISSSAAMRARRTRSCRARHGRRVLRSCDVVRNVDGDLRAVHVLAPAARALRRRSRPTATRICSTRWLKAGFRRRVARQQCGLQGRLRARRAGRVSGRVRSRALSELVLLRRSHADRSGCAPGNAAAGHRRHLPRNRQPRPGVRGALSAAVRGLQARLPLQRAAALHQGGSRQRLRQLDRLHRLTCWRSRSTCCRRTRTASTACCSTPRTTANRSASRASICTACRTRSRRASRRKCRCCSGPREATSSAPA